MKAVASDERRIVRCLPGARRNIGIAHSCHPCFLLIDRIEGVDLGCDGCRISATLPGVGRYAPIRNGENKYMLLVSARETYGKADAFWSWCADNLDLQ